MWYYTPSQDQHEEAPPTEVVAGAESDPRTAVRQGVEPGEPSPYPNTQSSSTAKSSPACPGSEYWLP